MKPKRCWPWAHKWKLATEDRLPTYTDTLRPEWSHVGKIRYALYWHYCEKCGGVMRRIPRKEATMASEKDHVEEAERLLIPDADNLTDPFLAQTHALLALVEQVARLADAVEGVTPEDATGRRVINIVRVSP